MSPSLNVGPCRSAVGRVFKTTDVGRFDIATKSEGERRVDLGRAGTVDVKDDVVACSTFFCGVVAVLRSLTTVRRQEAWP